MENEGKSESNSFWLGIKKSHGIHVSIDWVSFKSIIILFSFLHIYMYITSLIKFYFVLQEKKRNETKVSLGIRLIKRKYKNSYVWLCFRNLEIKISSTKERQWNPTNNTLYINLYIIEIRRKFVFQFFTLFAVSISFTLHATIPSKAQERDLKFYVRLKKQ